ncbi:MAG: succinate dehydrogenase cytochrome b subunit [Acidobacteriota bacterium]|nr:MAG: succinate dehydrogenase cytochrome b subunit [Acidobacteriota bacterium]
MSKSGYAIWSTVGKKFLLALTGLSLVGFICVHLVGNLLLYVGADAFNTYAHKLMSMGPLLYVAELILAALFLAHMFTAIVTTLNNWKSRPDRYAVNASQGSPSQMTVSSKTMIWTGLVIIGFTVFHLVTFKYGAGVEEGYVAYLDGEPVRDLYRLVQELFQDPFYSGFYVFVMILLGFHLRHGFWSAFQSLGLNHPRYTPMIHTVGIIAAVVLGVGFLVIPIWFYFTGGAA